ncbi:HEPN domain-containing protein [Ammonifex degensii]|uniref:HEPN domain-containing protein n=1 Tax=Ammonifex degensii TaxID=42838 RepID=UPI00067423DA
MRRSPKEEAERWWRQALHDYEDAQFCFQGKRYHLTCFLAQQSAERALKAFLYSRGISGHLGGSRPFGGGAG